MVNPIPLRRQTSQRWIVLWEIFIFVSVDASAQPPNVLFLVVDDLRPTLGCYNDPLMKTMNIDGLASKSVLFENAHVQQPICGPSRISFLTSRRPDTTRLYDFYSYWRVHAGNYTTLPQHFKENGYIAQSVGKVFHPGIASNFTDDYPYSWTYKAYHPSTQKYKMAPVCPNADDTRSMNIVCPVEVDKMPEKSLPDIQSANFAINFLKNMSSTHQKRPFFLAIGFHKPHVPLKYPKEYKDLYPLNEIHLAKYHTYPLRMPLVAWNPWTDLRMRDDVKKLNVSFPFGPVPDDFQLLLRQSYYAATTYMDVQVGRVLAALDKYNLSDNTIISFVGDHGWALGENQEWSKYSLFNPAVLVPMMFYIPGITYKRRDEHEKIFPFYDPFIYHGITVKNSYEYQNLTRNVHNHLQKIETDINLTNLRKNVTGEDAKNKIPTKYKDIVEDQAKSYLSSQQTHGSLFNTQTAPQGMKGYRTSAQMELVDIFPTLAEAAGLPRLPICPEDTFHTMLCTEGMSLMSLIKNITRIKDSHSIKSIELDEVSDGKDKVTIFKLAKKCSPEFQSPRDDIMNWKKAVFSQYPRPSVEPREDSDKPILKNIRIMGYSMWTPSFHYTEWVGFDPTTYHIEWKDVYGKELYFKDTDPYEIDNLAYFDQCAPLISTLSVKLHEGWRAAMPKNI